MTVLYSAKSTIDAEGHLAYRVTKFHDGEVESSYLTNGVQCDCPAGVRPTCRHRQMLPAMIAEDIINTQWFLDWDGERVAVDFDGHPRPPLGQPDPTLPAGEALQRDLPFVDIPGGLEKRKGLTYPAIPSPAATWRRF